MALNKKGDAKGKKSKAPTKKTGSVKKPSEATLKEMKKVELLELASSMGVKGVSRLKKGEIIEKILDDYKGKSTVKEDKPKRTVSPKKTTKKIEKSSAKSKNSTTKNISKSSKKPESKKQSIEKIDYGIEKTHTANVVDSKELDKEYGEDTLKLMVRDPYWAYAYWELTEKTRDRLGLKGTHNKKLKIRLYEVENGSRKTYYDIQIHDFATSWYIGLPHANKQYTAELLTEDVDGKVSFIIGSNVVEAPRNTISEDVDFEWMTPEWVNIYGASAGYREKNLSEDELKRRFEETPSSMSLQENHITGFLGASENNLSSLPSSDSVIKSELNKGKDFWLKADCELIVYGATEPDAEVRVKGDIIRMNADGTFTLRFALPNGEHTIDINAVNRDRDMEKSIVFHISRDTDLKL